jgi:hypothetical protein
VNALPPTQLGTHLADRATAAAVTLRTGGSGVVLGRDDSGGLAGVALFRPEPTTGVLVGGIALAQLVAFRSLAVGAAVVVETGRPAAWQAFVNLAAGSTGSITTVAHAPDEGPGTVDRPRLLVVDADSPASVEPHRPGGWSTVLTAHDRASSWNAPLLAGCDVALLHQLAPGEARVVATALNLPDAARALSGQPPGRVAVASRAGWRSVSVQLTEVERWLIRDLVR